MDILVEMFSGEWYQETLGDIRFDLTKYQGYSRSSIEWIEW